jgi:hypothetical protein
VRRRVERVTFIDEDSLVRSVSVDCFLEREADAGVLYVPLAVIDKHPLVSFDVRDEHQRPLPVLSTGENGYLAWSALCVAAAFALERPTSRSVQVSLRDVVFARAGRAAASVHATRTLALDTDERAALFDNPTFVALLETLASGFVLLVEVPQEEDGRRIIKFAHAQPLARERRVPILASLGISPLSIEVDLPSISTAASFHFECLLPEAVQVIDASVTTKWFDGNHTQSSVSGGVSETDRAHVHVSSPPPNADAVVALSVLPSANGVLRPGALSAIGVVIVLAVGGLFGKRIQSSSDAAAAILLLGPGLLSTLILRPGEHGLASLALRGLRWNIAAGAAAAFIGAGLVALDLHGGALRTALLALASASLVPAVLLCLAWRSTARIARGSSG